MCTHTTASKLSEGSIWNRSIRSNETYPLEECLSWCKEQINNVNVPFNETKLGSNAFCCERGALLDTIGKSWCELTQINVNLTEGDPRVELI